MKYYEVSIHVRLVDGLQRLPVIRIIVEAPNRIEAITEVIHTYRLAIPDSIKKMDLEVGEVTDVTQAIEELML